MSIKVMSRVWDESEQKGSNLLLLLALADHAANDGFCWPGYKTLAQRIRMSERSVSRKIQELENDNEIYVIRQTGEHNWYVVRVGMSDEDVIETLKKRKMDTPDNLSPLTHVSIPPDNSVARPLTEPCHTIRNEPSNNHYISAHADTHPSEEKTWTHADIQYIEMVDAEDREHECENCDKPFDVYTLLDSAAKCYWCSKPFQVKNWHGAIIKQAPLGVRKKSNRESNNLSPWTKAPVREWLKLAGKAYPPTIGTAKKLAGIFKQIGAITDKQPAQVADAIARFPTEHEYWKSYDWPNDGFLNRLAMMLSEDAKPEPIDIDRAGYRQSSGPIVI